MAFSAARQLIRNALSKTPVFPFNFVRFSSAAVNHDTIFALSSGFGKCGVAVIRVSGSKTKSALLEMTGRKKLPTPNKAFVSLLKNPRTNVTLDRALVMWFAAPNSFTGEDICEFQVHGGPAVITSVLSALSSFEGLRPAEAGDFTKRAFLNDKFDLTEVEGLGDLIHAETEAQRRQALLQMEGSLASLYKSWNEELLRNVAHLEAFIDFSEDQGLDSGLLSQIKIKNRELIAKVERHLADDNRGERLRNGVRISIIGRPNVGKSSLLNWIVRRPAAIVSDVAGTTRDVIESTLDVGGFPVVLSDTAGLCDACDVIEAEGVRRAQEKLRVSDLVLFVLDASEIGEDFESYLETLMSDLKIKRREIDRKRVIVLVNKIDLLGAEKSEKLLKSAPEVCAVSCVTSEGLSRFLSRFTAQIERLCGGNTLGEFPSITQQRHREHLRNCVENLRGATKFVDVDVVIAAEHFRAALNELGRIAGKVGVDEILDVIFRDFCIGK